MRRTLIIGAVVAAGLLLAVRFGAPPAMHAMGLHPRYDGPLYRLPGKRVLIVTTSHSQLGAGGARTGVFSSEMTAPYYAFLDGGMTVELASIAGGEIPIDPTSRRWFVEAPSDKRFRNDAEFQRKARQSMKVDAVDFSRYDIVFLAGGWGAAYDLSESKALANGISQAWRNGKVVGGICHGPLGLVHARDASGKSLVQGRHLTAVTDRQVTQLGIAHTPRYPERELKAAGALFESASAFRDIFANHTVVDGHLVTGQNQNAGMETAQIMMRVAGGTPVVREPQ